MLKLKRKLEFRGHVYFQAVRPPLLLNALNWLKAHKALYKDIIIDIGDIVRSMTTLHSSEDNLDSDTNGKDLSPVESCSNVLTDESCDEIIK